MKEAADQPQLEDRDGDAVDPAIFSGLLRSMRPHLWIKNLFVLAPLIFSRSYTDPTTVMLAVIAAFLFCMISSTVYLLNDIFDVEKDRRHPIKRHRPIASGQLPVRTAAMMCGMLGLGTLAISYVAFGWHYGAVLSTYFVLNLGYSTRLKHVAFVDVSIIAIGFVLRVLAGAFSIDVYVSEWIIVCTFLLALYLGLGKRQHELAMVAAGHASKVRKVLERYRPEQLDFALLFAAGLTIAAYTIYTLTAALPALAEGIAVQPLRDRATPFSHPWLPGTIPFAVFGITRFYQLVNTDDLVSPTELILKDVPFLVNLGIWGMIMVALGLAA